MIALLDVNMLIALMDDRHLFHGRAQVWWRAEKRGGWASCPLTQNGFLRIVTQKKYSNPSSMADALTTLARAVNDPHHHFWPDDVSLLDTTLIDHSRLLGPRHLIDVTLLALAVKHGGRLVTLDTGISVRAVRGGKAAQLVKI